MKPFNICEFEVCNDDPIAAVFLIIVVEFDIFDEDGDDILLSKLFIERFENIGELGAERWWCIYPTVVDDVSSFPISILLPCFLNFVIASDDDADDENDGIGVWNCDVDFGGVISRNFDFKSL